MIDPHNIRIEYDYDPLHRLVEVAEDVAGLNIQTGYQYDSEGNLTQLTINNEPLTIFRYDALNRLDEMENALGHLTDYDYDSVGNLDQLTKPDLAVISYQYDLLNRLSTIDYPAPEADVTFGYDKPGNRTVMTDTTGVTSYGYDDLDRLASLTDGNNQTVGYGYDARGNRTSLTYPDSKTVTYSYDEAGRLAAISPSWDSGSYSYEYLNHRLITVTTPSGLQTSYSYDGANRLAGITHRQNDQSLGAYTYVLDEAGNVRVVTESLVTLLPGGVYQESDGQVVLEAEKGQTTPGFLHHWLTATHQSGYTGTAYLQALPDVDQLYQASALTASPKAEYSIYFSTPQTYTVWLRGYPANAAGDSVYVGLGASEVAVTGFVPGEWSWAATSLSGAPATLPVETSGLQTVTLRMREDGLRIDRLLLTTDTHYIPTGLGPVESSQPPTITTTITRTLVYTYDNLYRLTDANYSTGEFFSYTYDPAGNRKTQTTLAGTTVYTYDAANRLTQVDGQSYSWDNNGNLLSDGIRTFTYDSENRLISVISGSITSTFVYNGDGDRYAQTVNGVTTDYVLDPSGLAQVLVESSGGQSTHYLPGLAQYDTTNGWQYVTADKLGSVRLLVKPNGELALSRSFDPFGNVLEQTGVGQSSFGYTGEQTDPTGLVFLRARYYDPALGRFITPDSLIPDPMRSQAWNRYAYVKNNPIRYTDPSGYLDCEGVMPFDNQLFPSECVGPGRSSKLKVNLKDLVKAVADVVALGIALMEGIPTLPGFTETNTLQDDEIKPCFDTGREYLPPIVSTPLDSSPFPTFFGTPIDQPKEFGDGMFTVSSLAKKIAEGHAYDKHVIEKGEFPEISNPDEFAQLIDDVMTSFEATKSLSKGRRAYWKGDVVVITNPADQDGGTAFRPSAGKTYYDNLK